jgi:uncharacterized RmlC-like cupin family protein
MILTPAELERRHIRRRQYTSCDDAFIDVRLPGSQPKHNYSIVGPGVTQNADQPINLREPHGFNIGAAGLPPGVTNNLHLHFTAEVFIVCEGRFELRWGARGDEGQAVLEPLDTICMPPWMFRGFSCIGSDDGFLMTVLGGDDTGGIIWSPDVMQRARETGLWLGRDNQIIEVAPGAAEPPAEALLPPMPADEVARLRRWTAPELMARALRHGERDFCRATLDAHLPGHGWEIAPCIGFGLSHALGHLPRVSEPQGFSVEWIRVPPGGRSAPFVLDRTAVLVHARGPLAVVFNGDDSADAPVRAELGAWDTLSMPAGCTRQWVNTGDEPAEALLVVRGDAPKPLRYPEPQRAGIEAAAAALDLTLDAGGHLARRSLLPPAMTV